MNKTLHIFFGDSVGGTFKQTEIPGDVLVWHEIYTEGPLSRDIYHEGLFEKRIEFFAKRGLTALYENAVKEQESTLNKTQDYDEIVIWSEHDLFDQTILIYLLNYFFDKNLGDKLKMITTDKFPGIPNFKGLGQLNVEQLSSLWGTQKPITKEQLATGKSAWQSYTSPNPQDVEKFLVSDDQSLPYLNEAFLYHLKRFPSVKNGLNQMEKFILKQIEHNPGRDAAAYCGDFLANGNFPDTGDWQYFVSVLELSKGKNPLILLDGDLLTYMQIGKQWPKEKRCYFTLSESGQQVLQGKADAIKTNGIDRWVGGVHLIGTEKLWRLDNSGQLIFK